MCKRFKFANLINEERAWKIPMTSGVFAFILGLSCFGVGMKLSEYKKSPSLPPMIAGIPVRTTQICDNCKISKQLFIIYISD